ncbi:transporter DMT superfamily protein [Thraustotheca clavata]|uniref:Transporter DMT superfamily protein n=1 Tax=Thraustotheca clavata TaxID=74557 RepID=A0A1V9ZXU7_9STRA|nr:transporter DMT superfamily protein [Thraustotheca clavata]
MIKGILCAIASFSLYGFLPIYWKQLSNVPSLQVAVHSALWTGILLLLGITLLRHWRSVGTGLWTKRNFAVYGVSIVLLTNTLHIAIVATNTNRIIEMSMGFFIAPFVTGMLAQFFCHDKLNRWQLISVCLAMLGVVVASLGSGEFPILSILLSLSYSLYNLTKMIVPLPPLESVTLKAWIIIIPGAALLFALNEEGSGAFGHVSGETDTLLVFTGVVSLPPMVLLLLSAPLTPPLIMSVLQHIAPVFQLFIGMFVYDEPFSIITLLGFIIIWVAIFVSTKDDIQKAEMHTAIETECGTPTAEYNIACSVIAFAGWGVLPLYWKELMRVSMIESAVHCMLWSGILFMLIILLSGQWNAFCVIALTKRNIIYYFISGLLLALIYFFLIFGTIYRSVIMLAMGYFLCPLVDGLFARLFLKESLSLRQYLALVLSVIGVGLVWIGYKMFPFIGLVFGNLLGFYNIIKRVAPMEPLYGYTLETSLMLLPATIYFIVMGAKDKVAFAHVDAHTNILLVCTGFVVVAPLLLHARAAKLVPPTIITAISYITPTILFFLGVFKYQEPISLTELVGLIIIWIAFLVFTVEQFRQSKKGKEAEIIADIPYTTIGANCYLAIKQLITISRRSLSPRRRDRLLRVLKREQEAPRIKNHRNSVCECVQVKQDIQWKHKKKDREVNEKQSVDEKLAWQTPKNIISCFQEKILDSVDDILREFTTRMTNLPPQEALEHRIEDKLLSLIKKIRANVKKQAQDDAMATKQKELIL